INRINNLIPRSVFTNSLKGTAESAERTIQSDRKTVKSAIPLRNSEPIESETKAMVFAIGDNL
ncbi:MAG: hypothetical protein XD94_0116, partial [Mesotoga prima]